MEYLRDILPAHARKHVYGILTLSLVVYGIWQASQGDWEQFIVSLVTASGTALATGNTDTEPSE